MKRTVTTLVLAATAAIASAQETKVAIGISGWTALRR